MSKFNVGDTVKSAFSGAFYIVQVVPTYDGEDGKDPRRRVLLRSIHMKQHRWAEEDGLVLVKPAVDLSKYTKKFIPGYGECLVPVVPTPENAPVGSLWKGVKGGRYVVINERLDAFDFNSKKIYKLPSSATFVADNATEIIVKHEDGQL